MRRRASRNATKATSAISHCMSRSQAEPIPLSKAIRSEWPFPIFDRSRERSRCLAGRSVVEDQDWQ
jgi:hypothetical protein